MNNLDLCIVAVIIAWAQVLNWMPYGNSMPCVCQVLLHGGTWTEASCAFLAARSCALLAARSYAFHVLLLKPFCCVIALTCGSLADKSLTWLLFVLLFLRCWQEKVRLVKGCQTTKVQKGLHSNSTRWCYNVLFVTRAGGLGAADIIEWISFLESVTVWLE